MRKAPCKDCFNRKLLCHGFCDEYKEWKKELDEYNEKKRQEKENRTNKDQQPFWKKFNKQERNPYHMKDHMD